MIDLFPGGGFANGSGAEQQARSDAVVDDVARGPAGGGGLDDALHVRAGQVPLLRETPALQQVSQFAIQVDFSSSEPDCVFGVKILSSKGNYQAMLSCCMQMQQGATAPEGAARGHARVPPAGGAAEERQAEHGRRPLGGGHRLPLHARQVVPFLQVRRHPHFNPPST